MHDQLGPLVTGDGFVSPDCILLSAASSGWVRAFGWLCRPAVTTGAMFDDMLVLVRHRYGSIVVAKKT